MKNTAFQITLFSNKFNEINTFLSKFYGKNLEIPNRLVWSKSFENPIDMSELIAAYIDNKDFFKINMWITLDKSVYINVTEKIAEEVLKYLFERFPY